MSVGAERAYPGERAELLFFCSRPEHFSLSCVNVAWGRTRGRPCGTASISIASTVVRSFERLAKHFAGLSGKSQTYRRTLEGKSIDFANWNRLGRL